MTPVPQIVNATPEQNENARNICRAQLEYAVRLCAGTLSDQPLSIKALMARLLIEDFAELDVNATRDWLDANDDENAATHLLLDGHVRTHRINTAREHRCAAFTKLAEAEIARSPTR